jgi:hypothetical protein
VDLRHYVELGNCFGDVKQATKVGLVSILADIISMEEEEVLAG